MAVTWATKQNLTQVTAIGTTEKFFDSVDASASVQTQVELKINNNSGSITDNLIASVYLTLDTSSEDWDDHPFMTFTLQPDDVNEEKWTFLLPSVFKWRIGMISEGGTDTYVGDVSYTERTE